MPGTELTSYPLTPMQEGMLFHSVSAPGTGVEIEQIACITTERLDRAALEEAWRRVIARHPALRTRFRLEGAGAPVQEVVSEASVELLTLPAGTLLEDALAADRLEDFALDRTCMRVRVCERAADWYMLWSFHHGILDGRSFPVVLRDLFDCYAALLRGQPWQPSPAAGRFEDFAGFVSAHDASGSRGFWEQMLSGVEAADHPLLERGGAPNSGDFGAVELRLEPAHATALRIYAAGRDATMNTLLQAAWAITLHNHTRAAAVTFGGTRACRHVPVAGVADLVGLLINTVPMAVDVRAASVDELVRRTRERWVSIRPHELTPLTQVQKWVGREHASFDSIVVFEQAELRDTLRAAGGDWSQRDFVYRGRTGYPLTLIGYDGNSPLLRLEYDRALVTDQRAHQLLHETARALVALPASASVPPARVPVHRSDEREKLLRLATPRRDYAHRAGSIPARVLAFVAEQPHAAAVRAGDATQDYATLAARSASIASALVARGTARGSRVGVMVERGMGSVETMLGVLRSGACYVPIDIDAPTERVRFILDDAGVDVILRTGGGTIAGRDTLDPAELAAAPTRPLLDPAPHDAAYVIYTSGSTGRPKGVVVTHANVTRLLDACADLFDFSPADVWSCFHSFSFDFSVWEIWGALMTGGATVIASREEVFSPQRFAELLERERVTVLSQTPSAFRQLQDEILARTSADLPLRYVVFGGEALDPRTLRGWLHRFGDERPRLINMYGITETTVHVTFRRMTRADADAIDSLVGLPLPDLGVLLVNAGGGLAPVGAPAEMLVCGQGVADGYLNRPELTLERFVENAALPGVRFYRSGDLARLLPDGSLQFLGRADAQVKVRGHRIEPGEVESAMRAVGGVRDARVIARRVDADTDLVGYYIPTAAPVPTTLLREALLRTLPSYMVPKWFVAVPSIPLTRNGKIDTNALPEPERERDGDVEYVAPVGAVEQTIAEIWAATLGVSRVGTRDNFFDLGGDSLLLVRTAGLLSERLGRRVEVVRLFEYPTVESLAGHLAGSATDDRYEEIAARAARQRGNFLAVRRS